MPRPWCCRWADIRAFKILRGQYTGADVLAKRVFKRSKSLNNWWRCMLDKTLTVRNQVWQANFCYRWKAIELSVYTSVLFLTLMICSWKCALCVERVCWFDLEATFIDSTKSSLCIIIWCVQWLRHCCCIIFLKRQDTLLYITTSLKLSLSKRSNIKHIATGRVFLDKVWRLN